MKHTDHDEEDDDNDNGDQHQEEHGVVVWDGSTICKIHSVSLSRPFSMPIPYSLPMVHGECTSGH